MIDAEEAAVDSTSVLAGCPPGYTPQRVLKRSSAGETVLAVHGGTGASVVVKSVDANVLSAEARIRLEHEGALLRRLDCPGIASAIDMVYAQGRLHIVLPYIDGVTLRQRLASGPLDLADTLTVARSMLTALSGIHSHGVLHRDLKPENVIVDSTRPLREVTIIDLGFATSPALVHTVRERVVGTPRYMAPEQAGMLDRPVDCRADLYSLGIILFECLAGCPPFDAPDVRDVLRQQLSTPLPSLRAMGVPVPHAVEEILRRLTHKDPDDRYRGAQAGLADVVSLAEALRRGVTEPDVIVGLHDPRQTLTEPALTGRETELSVLHRGLADASAGTNGLVVVDAESGGGKSRVLEEFCCRATSSGAWVLRGQGIELAAQYPLQVLAGVISDIVAAPERMPTLAEQLGDAAGPLRQALPELADMLPGEPSTPVVAEAQARTRIVAALVALLNALGSPGHPAVIALDDCQWVDELTFEVLQAWAQQFAGEDAAAGHVLVVVAVRPTEGVSSRLVAALGGAQRVSLPAMSPEQVGRIVQSMAGVVPDQALRAVVDLSRGNPFMVSAVLRGLVESGALSAKGSAWRFTPAPGGSQTSWEAAPILEQRLALLTPSTRRVLTVGAVLGRTFDPRTAALLAGQKDQAAAVVRQAVERHLIWWDAAGTCSFAHDRLRASLLADLDDAARAELHRRAAEHLEASAPTRSFELAYHFDEAGEPDRALRHAMESAAAARARHDLGLAERQYRIAERGAERDSGRTRAHVAEALGQILTLRGRYEEAAERFEFALSLADDDISVARLEGELGEVLFRTDDLEGSVRHIEAGLRVLGERIPVTTASLVVSLLWETLRRLTGFVRRPRAARSGTSRERELVRSHLYTQLQYPRWFHRRRLAVIWLMLRQVNVAERCPDNPELPHSYGVWGGALTVTFPFLVRAGLRHVRRCLDLSRARHDLRGEGHAESMRTCALLSAARYRDGAETGRRAAEILGQYGDRWEVNFASRNRAVCLYRLGRFREAVEEARVVHRAGVEIGDTNAEVTALEVIAKATGGQVPAGQTWRALRSGGSDLEVITGAAQAEALRLRHTGKLEEAAECLEKAVAEVRRTWPPSAYLVPAYSWLATLHRELAEGALLPAPRRRLLRRAQRSARLAVRHCRVYPGERPHALREAALVAALRGRSRRARRLARRGAEAAVRQEAWAELAETRRQCARLGLPAVENVGEGAVDLEPFAGSLDPPTLGLADRFASLLEAGALLASASSPDAIMDAVRQTATTLLRADRCILVGFGTDNEEWPTGAVTGRAVAQQAAQQRQPIVLSEPFDAEHDVGDSLVLAGVRSLLCAPIFVQDDVVGCFLASHSQVGQLFGEEEQRLAEFVARLAGAAMERQRLHCESRARIVSAQEAERARIARDLHDEIGQTLSSVLLRVRMLEDDAHQREDLLAHASELRDLITAGLQTTQKLAFDLRPAVLDDFGLVAALRRLISNTAGVPTKLEVVELADSDRLPPDVETTAFRVVQESLTNVTRHANASECSIVIARDDDRLRVIVEDDGIGFDPSSRTIEGLGLRGMSERAELIGGTLRVNAAPGEGTMIVFEVILG